MMHIEAAEFQENFPLVANLARRFGGRDPSRNNSENDSILVSMRPQVDISLTNRAGTGGRQPR